MSWKTKAFDDELIVYCREINQIVNHQRGQPKKDVIEVKRIFSVLVV